MERKKNSCKLEMPRPHHISRGLSLSTSTCSRENGQKHAEHHLLCHIGFVKILAEKKRVRIVEIRVKYLVNIRR